MSTKRWVSLVALALTAILAGWVFATSAQNGQESASRASLYNGIVLPDQWPPVFERWTREPVVPPYLYDPPEVIPIDLGRQLFVDDFLIEHTDLLRVVHRPEVFGGSPVLQPDQDWERVGRGETAMPFSDGIWFDPSDSSFKMFYMGGYTAATCLALSQDGITWAKPDLGVVPRTNIVLPQERDGCTIILDLKEPDVNRRFKMAYTLGENSPLFLRFSPDGIHWSEIVTQSEGNIGGRHSVFFNPFRGVWVFSLRDTWASQPGGRLPVSRTVSYVDQIGGSVPVGRARRYYEHPDIVAGCSFRVRDTFRWLSADRLDPFRGPLQEEPPSQIYNLDCIAYESLLLGFFSVWQAKGGPPATEAGLPGLNRRPKLNEILMGYSRDGFHWHRPDRRPFIGVSEAPDSWRHGNVQSVGGGCLVIGDRLFFYFSGRKSLHEEVPTPKGEERAATGLAILRRDGFASMRAPAKWEGSLTTRPVRFTGSHLFLNASCAQGELRVQVTDLDGRALAHSEVVTTDSTILPVRWTDGQDLSRFDGETVRIRFFVRNGDLYAFWVSRSPEGDSGGFVAAGGPGFLKPIDDAGLRAYNVAESILRRIGFAKVGN